jgi:membrane protein YqaA with SNARE-associated domain
LKEFFFVTLPRIIRGILEPFGIWGVFGFALIDSIVPIMPLDPVVVGYFLGYRNLFWLTAILAAAGSTLGSSVYWLIGDKGGEPMLAKRFGEERLEAMRLRFSKIEFLGLMIPAMLPPPTPFKLIILAAGVFGVHYGLFAAAVFTGRMARFLILSFLTLKGPGIFRGVAAYTHQPLWLLGLEVVALGVTIFFAVRWLRARRRGRVAS